MDPSQLPPGGLPWVLAAPAFMFLILTSIGVVKWIALRADRKIEEADARTVVANEGKEKIRVELTRKIEELENEVQDELRNALDLMHASIHGKPLRPKEPPPGIERKKRSTRELLAEVRGAATGAFRRADLMDDTQGI